MIAPEEASFADRMDAALAAESFWDDALEALYRSEGVPRADRILQNRDEVAMLLSWMHRQGIESYMEIGIWTGRLLRVMDTLFNFGRIFACDRLDARDLGLPVSIPSGAEIFVGDSHSLEYRLWREAKGYVDLVFIDGDHSFEGVSRDFEINRRFPHRFLAFHDIRGGYPDTRGVRDFWEALDTGHKHEIVASNPDMKSGGRGMGIGIWRA